MLMVKCELYVIKQEEVGSIISVAVVHKWMAGVNEWGSNLKINPRMKNEVMRNYKIKKE